MKKTQLFILFLFSVSVLWATNSTVKSYSIKWNIQTWTANEAKKSVLSFQDAAYPNETYLPYFSMLIPYSTQEPQMSLENEVFENLTAEELKIIQQSGFDIQSSIVLTQKGSFSGTFKAANVLFLPLTYTNGKYQKLVSFDLRTTISSTISKALKAPSSVHTFATTSVLSSGKWVKMKVPSSGIYKLTYQDIVSAGLNPNDIHVYGYGGAMLSEDFYVTKQDDLSQVAICFDKGADGIFNSGDYILFYAQGPISWTYQDGTSEFAHTTNPYSNAGYYFLSSGISAPTKSIAVSPVVDLQGNTPTVINNFVDYALYEKDLVNLATSGREFYGEEFSQTSVSKNISFSFPNIITSSVAYARFDGAIFTRSDSDSPTSTFNISVSGSSNDVSAYNIKSSDYYAKANPASTFMSFTPSSTINVNLTFNPIVSGSKGWFNYLSITAQRRLIMDGKLMFFRNPGLRYQQYGRFQLTTSNGNIKIWDITDQGAIKEIPTTFDVANSLLSFDVESQDATTIREFVAIDMTNSFAKPEIVGQIENQNLHALHNTNFVIISHPDYIAQAQKLAAAHQEKDNMTVVIVTPEQIYNEFSSGTPDATAYRWFLKMFYDRKNNGTESNDVKYLLLLGDGTYDNRQLLSPADNCNKILTYESYNSLVETSSYVTDDYFGFLDDSEGTNIGSDLLDIGVGRMPVNTVAQADDVINKVIRYMDNDNKGQWKNKLCYVADDGDGDTHVDQSDSLARKIGRMNPEYEITKLYLDAYKQQTTSSGSSYPEVQEKLQNLVKNGLLMLNYTGHGGTSGWADEKVMTNQEIINMYNDNLALWVTATCDFSRFDSKELAAGENVLLNPTGGGIALFTTTRVVYSQYNFNLNLKFSEYVFSRDADGNRLRLGDIMKLTKRSYNELNKLNFSLLGDPALMLAYPAYKIQTDSIKGEDANAEAITIGALDKVTVKGHVLDNDDNLMSDFNGILTITVFDKEQNINTLANDAASNVFTYQDRSIIFLGKAQVVNGEFSVTFMVPKDINYTYGIGKINYYAADNTNNYEAHGYYNNFIIGGSSDEVIIDNEGPQIDMYLNTSSFVSQDKVNESPLFIANVSDENGINIVGSGIGHDVVMMLDNKDWIVLNDYFNPDLGTYKSGTIQYKMSNLENGQHTLTFRVWDLLNNSSSDSFEFEVVNGLSVGIIDAYCYPNPATDGTTFVLKHDRPDEIMTVVLRIYDLTGRELWSFDSDLYPSDDSTTITDWNLETSSGHKLKKGIYLYKVEVTTPSGKMSTKSRKIVIAG